jgi:Domain of unknown function (DUF4786)
MLRNKCHLLAAALLLTSICGLHAVTVPTAKLRSSIAEVNKKFAQNHPAKPVAGEERTEKEVGDFNRPHEKAAPEAEPTDEDTALKNAPNNFPFQMPNDLTGAESAALRENKMFGYYGIYPPTGGYPAAAAFIPTDYYDDYNSGYGVGYGGFGGFSGFGGYGALPGYAAFGGFGGYDPSAFGGFAAYNGLEDDDLLGRTNQRRRPQGNTKNSPIYYIRLPPTPYMFVPGLGYISQPPTLAPISPFGGNQYGGSQFGGNQYGGNQFGTNPYAPTPSPFYNLPLNFLANGKPSSIYQWNGGQTVPQQYENPYQQRPTYQQRPQYAPAPQRPAYRPQNPYIQDSKITHLKGPFLFNGRPEDIFVLPNPYHQFNQYNQFNPYTQFRSPYHGFF